MTQQHGVSGSNVRGPRGWQWFAIPAAMAVAACGFSEDDAGNAHRLDPVARDELVSIGTSQYFGQARVVREESHADGAVSVYFDPASGPVCLYGAEFIASYLDRGSDDLGIWLDQGGACWTGNCSAEIIADRGLVADGSFPDHPELGQFNAVFIPYCDGSVYAGDNIVHEPNGRTRFHHGRRNIAAGLDLAARRFPNPKRVLLAGSSAGAYGTIFAMAAVRLRYPKAELMVMSDGGPGVINLLASEDVEARLREWKWNEAMPPSCEGCGAGRGQPAALFGWMLQRDVSLRVSLLSFEQDPVISGYLNMSMGDYAPLLAAESGKLHDAHPRRFRRYIIAGAGHTVFPGLVAGVRTADGIGPIDWIDAMVRHDVSVWRDVTGTFSYDF
jgi:hypothetical protein